MKKILINGGAGYINSHVGKLLKKKGYEVFAIDNLSSGNKEAVIYGKLFVADLKEKEIIDDILKKIKHYLGWQPKYNDLSFFIKTAWN